MANKVNHIYVEGLLPLEGNSGKFIGIKNNTLTAQSRDELLYNLDISPFVSFCLNSCEDNFLSPYGLVAENDSISIYPMTIQDSTGNVILNLTEKITKSINGLFEEGNNKGCKDNSYIKWQQPLLNSEITELGECKQTVGTNVEPAYQIMDGINNNYWLSSTPASTVYFKSIIPFIAESIILVNTNTSNRTRNLNISTDTKTLVSNYFCNADANAQNYINIEKENRTESQILNIQTLSAFLGNEVGFNEIIINAKTRYIQQNTKYNVFLISNEDQTKMDILISSLSEPILPENYVYYAFIQEVKTKAQSKSFVSSLGNDLYFETTNFPAKITNAKNQTALLENINYIQFENVDSSNIIKYNIYLKLDGTAYARTQEYYKCYYEFPENPTEGDVISIIKNANIEAYEFNGTEWVEFNDVPVGEVYRYQNRTIFINQFPCNNNFYIKSIDNNIWSQEELYVSNRNYIYSHNLNIENIKEYKCDCSLICIENDNNYSVGDCALVTSPIIPFFNKTNIGLKITTISALDKSTGSVINLSQNKWKLVFRIWR